MSKGGSKPDTRGTVGSSQHRGQQSTKPQVGGTRKPRKPIPRYTLRRGSTAAAPSIKRKYYPKLLDKPPSRTKPLTPNYLPKGPPKTISQILGGPIKGVDGKPYKRNIITRGQDGVIRQVYRSDAPSSNNLKNTLEEVKKLLWDNSPNYVNPPFSLELTDEEREQEEADSRLRRFLHARYEPPVRRAQDTIAPLIAQFDEYVRPEQERGRYGRDYPQAYSTPESGNPQGMRAAAGIEFHGSNIVREGKLSSALELNTGIKGLTSMSAKNAGIGPTRTPQKSTPEQSKWIGQLFNDPGMEALKKISGAPSQLFDDFFKSKDVSPKHKHTVLKALNVISIAKAYGLSGQTQEEADAGREPDHYIYRKGKNIRSSDYITFKQVEGLKTMAVNAISAPFVNIPGEETNKVQQLEKEMNRFNDPHSPFGKLFGIGGTGERVFDALSGIGQYKLKRSEIEQYRQPRSMLSTIFNKKHKLTQDNAPLLKSIMQGALEDVESGELKMPIGAIYGRAIKHKPLAKEMKKVIKLADATAKGETTSYIPTEELPQLQRYYDAMQHPESSKARQIIRANNEMRADPKYSKLFENLARGKAMTWFSRNARALKDDEVHPDEAKAAYDIKMEEQIYANKHEQSYSDNVVVGTLPQSKKMAADEGKRVSEIITAMNKDRDVMEKTKTSREIPKDQGHMTYVDIAEEKLKENHIALRDINKQIKKGNKTNEESLKDQKEYIKKQIGFNENIIKQGGLAPKQYPFGKLPSDTEKTGFAGFVSGLKEGFKKIFNFKSEGDYTGVGGNYADYAGYPGGGGGGGGGGREVSTGQLMMPILRALLLGVGGGGGGLATAIGASGKKGFSMPRSIWGLIAQVALGRVKKGVDIYETTMRDRVSAGSAYVAQGGFKFNQDGKVLNFEEFNRDVLENTEGSRWKDVGAVGLNPQQYFAQLRASSHYLGGIASGKIRTGDWGTKRMTTLPEEFARTDLAFGLPTGTSLNTAISTRQALGMSGAKEATEKLVEIGFTHGLKKELVPYIKTMVSLLGRISPAGTGTLSPIATMVGDFAADAGISPEAAGHAALSVHEGVKSAQGDRAAAIQMAYIQGGAAANPLEAEILTGLGNKSLDPKFLVGTNFSPGFKKAATDANFRNNLRLRHLNSMAEGSDAGRIALIASMEGIEMGTAFVRSKAGEITPGKEPVEFEKEKQRNLKQIEDQTDYRNLSTSLWNKLELQSQGRGVWTTSYQPVQLLEAQTLRAGRIIVNESISSMTNKWETWKPNTSTNYTEMVAESVVNERAWVGPGMTEKQTKAWGARLGEDFEKSITPAQRREMQNAKEKELKDQARIDEKERKNQAFAREAFEKARADQRNTVSTTGQHDNYQAASAKTDLEAEKTSDKEVKEQTLVALTYLNDILRGGIHVEQNSTPINRKGE